MKFLNKLFDYSITLTIFLILFSVFYFHFIAYFHWFKIYFCGEKMNNIYVFTDAGLYEHYSKKGTGKKNKKGLKKVYNVSCGAFQYNNPETKAVIKKGFHLKKSFNTPIKAEEKTILAAFDDINETIQKPSNIILYTDQKALVDFYHKRCLGEKFKNKGHLEKTTDEILKIEKEKNHKIKLIYVESTSSKKNKNIIKKAWHEFHSEMDKMCNKMLKDQRKMKKIQNWKNHSFTHNTIHIKR